MVTRIAYSLIIGVLFGLLGYLVVELFGGLLELFTLLLLVGLVSGLLSGLVSGLLGLRGSFLLLVGLLAGLLAMGVVQLGIHLVMFTGVEGPLAMLISGLVGGLVSGLFGGLLSGVTNDRIATRAIPNEGIRRSLHNALIGFLAFGLLSGLLSGLVGGLVITLASGVLSGLVGGLVTGLSAGLLMGGRAYLKHYVLRFLLWRYNYAPWNYIRFLNYAVERVFLRKVGGGYVFTHRLLKEYFATGGLQKQARG